MVHVLVGDEFHSDPSVGVCSVSWLCVVYSESWSRSTVQEMRQGVLIISNSFCSLGAQNREFITLLSQIQYCCHKTSNTTTYVLKYRWTVGGVFMTSTSGCVRHLTQDAVTQSWLGAPTFCVTFMVALAA